MHVCKCVCMYMEGVYHIYTDVAMGLCTLDALSQGCMTVL